MCRGPIFENGFEDGFEDGFENGFENGFEEIFKIKEIEEEIEKGFGKASIKMTIKKDDYKEVYKAILIDSTYLSHFMRWKLHGGRHQVVQKHTAFPKSHQTISWSQTFPNLNENLKLYRTLSRRF